MADILRFEWRYHTRQMSFLAVVLIYGALGFALTASGFGSQNVQVNSPYSIAQSLGLASLAAVFATAVFCARAVVRDREHQMEEIVFSTSVEKFPYLFGRFAGSFLAAFTAFSATVVGMLAALAMPWQDAARIGPIAPQNYVWTLLVLVLPGMLFAGALLFGVAALTRSMIATVVGAVAIYVFYFIAAALTNSPLMAASVQGAQTAPAAALLDPFGLSAFFEQTRYWTPAMRNSRLIALSGAFLVNRLVWVGAAALVWLFVYRRFSFRVLTPPRQRRSRNAGVLAGWPGVVSTPLLSSLRLELRSFMASIPFALLTLLWFALAVTEMLSDITGGEHGSALYPTTGFILGSIQQPLWIVAIVVVVYYSAEIVWHERMAGIAEVVRATPTPTAVFVFSKWIALSALILVLVASGSAAAVLVQMTRGYTHFEPGVTLAFAYFAAMPLVLFAAAAVLVQTLSANKYAGMFFVLVAGIVIRGGESFGLGHPLLRYASAPPIEYSAMNGFGPYAAPFHWFMALWSAVAALLLLLAAGRPRKLAAALALVAVAIAAFIFYNTNVLNTYESPSAALDWRAAHEKTYRSTATLPQPRVVAVNADVSLYPRERRYRVRGAYQLANDSTAPMTNVLVAVRRDARVESIAISGAKLLEHDRRFATRSYELDPPLQPGQRRELRFDLSYEPRGFEATTADNSIAANGTYIFDRRAFPSLGYRRGYEIRDAAQRKKRGLPPLPESSDGSHEDDTAADEWIAFDMTVSTDADQLALSSGRLERQWTSGGRRFFHYRSEAPMHSVFAIVSARYAVATANAGRTKVEVYYHPAHRANVARILSAATEAMRTCERSFAPYPHDVLRVAEVPAYWDFGGFATAGLVVLPEDRTFLIDARDPRRLDLITRRTAHEVSHQWWGHLVAPPNAPGASAIVESLAKYSELLVLEKKYGREVVRRSLATELDLYLAGRAAAPDPEPPLARSTIEPYVYYRKGAIVMYALRDLLGEAAFHRALHDFAAEQGGAGREPRIADLLRHIHAVAPPQHHALIDQWLREVVLYDLRLASANAKPLPGGRFEVTLAVTAQQRATESIEIGLFTRDETPIAVAHHPLHAGRNTIMMIVDKQPELAIVDPYFTRVDRSRFDNEMRIAARAPN